MGQLARKEDEHFTYGDYLSWNDDERWELIDGVPYDMSPAPRVAHQRILGNLHYQLFPWFIDKPCQLFLAPFDVRLPEADEADERVATVVQPDLLVVCDPGKLDQAGCRGAPDLIIEILSPGTAHKDLKIKFDLYERAGVREYWIVDPAERTVMLFTGDGDGRYGRPQVYGDHDRVRVSIFPGVEVALAPLFAEPVAQVGRS